MDKSEYENFLKKMRRISKIGDTEEAHPLADDILCDALELLGYNELVKIYKKIHKWYA